MTAKSAAVNVHDKHENQIKRTAGDWVFEIFLYVFFGIFTLLCIFPF